jgi:hypothetical protein
MPGPEAFELGSEVIDADEEHVGAILPCGKREGKERGSQEGRAIKNSCSKCCQH